MIDLRFAALAAAASLATTLTTLVSTGAPAHAATPIVVEATTAPSARVSHADLDLREAAGVRRLNARVRLAAERLCIEPGTKSVRVFAEGRTCLNNAIAGAEPQVRRAIAAKSNGSIAAGSK